MGAQQSVEIAEKLQHSTADQLLNDDSLMQSLQQTYPSLSAKSKDNLRRLVTQSPRYPAESGPLSIPKLRPLLSLKETDVVIPTPLQGWLGQGNMYLPRDFGLDQLISSNRGDMRTLLLDRYSHTLALEKRRIVDRIRWRFCSMSFYDLHLLVNEKDYLTSRGLDNLVQVIRSNDMSRVDIAEMRTNLKSWISRGHRYRNLSNALGGSGCLFLLPEKISDYLWEDALPLKGDAYEQAILKLKSIGVERIAAQLDAHKLASSIENLLLPYQWQLNNLPNLTASRKTSRPEQRAITATAHEHESDTATYNWILETTTAQQQPYMQQQQQWPTSSPYTGTPFPNYESVDEAPDQLRFNPRPRLNVETFSSTSSQSDRDWYPESDSTFGEQSGPSRHRSRAHSYNVPYDTASDMHSTARGMSYPPQPLPPGNIAITSNAEIDAVTRGLLLPSQLVTANPIPHSQEEEMETPTAYLQPHVQAQNLPFNQQYQPHSYQ